jgi:uncharacterized protein RhaS with RHS repeats
MAANCFTETVNAAPAPNNQLTGVTYDAAGNVLNDGNGNTPTYDAENRILADGSATYSYDADGDRIEKSSGTSRRSTIASSRETIEREIIER